MLRPLFHLSAVVINSFVLCYDQMYIELPFPVKEMENLPLKSRSMFLTIWCLILQTIYHFIAFLNDCMGTNEQNPQKLSLIRRVKDTLFALAFPTAVYVTIAFWSIYAVDKELIFPEHIEKLYPLGFNHVMHTTVGVFIIIELLTSYRNYPSRVNGFVVLFSFYISYVVWFFNVYFRTGAWVYPVFKPLNWPLRIVFITLSVFIATMFYILGEKISNFICSSRKEMYTNGTMRSAINGKKTS